MDELGYNSYYQVLNAKNYGVPQNRERVFTVSIRKDLEIEYEFPEGFELKLKLKDVLEENVDEKYYLSDKTMSDFITDTKNDIKMIGKLDIKGHDCVKRVYGVDGISPTLTDMQGGNRQPKIMTVGNYMPSNHDASRIVDEEGIAPTVKENHGTVTAVAMRGRYNASGKVEQQIEISSREIANSITTVQKDSMIGEGMRVRKDIKQEEKYCKYCGKQLERKRFNGRLEDFTVFKNRKYCNRECMKRAYLKIGENNQTYSNAHTTARKINELILHKEVCELCGSDTNLDIHHIDGNWKNNNFDNLMCLCRSCHTKYERNKDKIRGEMPMDDRLRIRKLTPKECWRL